METQIKDLQKMFKDWWIENGSTKESLFPIFEFQSIRINGWDFNLNGHHSVNLVATKNGKSIVIYGCGTDGDTKIEMINELFKKLNQSTEAAAAAGGKRKTHRNKKSKKSKKSRRRKSRRHR